MPAGCRTPVLAFVGIGRPAKFATLEALGVEIVSATTS
jgi:hypothetical protein